MQKQFNPHSYRGQSDFKRDFKIFNPFRRRCGLQVILSRSGPEYELRRLFAQLLSIKNLLRFLTCRPIILNKYH